MQELLKIIRSLRKRIDALSFSSTDDDISEWLYAMNMKCLVIFPQIIYKPAYSLIFFPNHKEHSYVKLLFAKWRADNAL